MGLPQLRNLAQEGLYSPTLLVTSGILCRDPLPQLFSLAACRAAQWNLLASCSKESGAQGVHCALVEIQDRFPDGSPRCDAQAVAQEAWRIYCEGGASRSLQVSST